MSQSVPKFSSARSVQIDKDPSQRPASIPNQRSQHLSHSTVPEARSDIQPPQVDRWDIQYPASAPSRQNLRPGTGDTGTHDSANCRFAERIAHGDFKLSHPATQSTEVDKSSCETFVADAELHRRAQMAFRRLLVSRHPTRSALDKGWSKREEKQQRMVQEPAEGKPFSRDVILLADCVRPNRVEILSVIGLPRTSVGDHHPSFLYFAHTLLVGPLC
jgi:hypothetical protein